MELIKAIAKRKSVRAYQTEQISDEVLHSILTAGCAAPVGLRQYDSLHFTTVQDKVVLSQMSNSVRELFKQMAKGENQGDPFYDAPTVILISSKQPPMPGLEYINAGCIAENMMLTATDLGVGSCVAGGAGVAVETNAELKKTLGIPEGFQVLFGLMFGYAVNDNQSEKDLKMTISSNRI